MRLRQAVSTTAEQNDLTTAKVNKLLTGGTPVIDKSTSIQEAAKKMAEDNYSALLVMDGEFVPDSEEGASPLVVS